MFETLDNTKAAFIKPPVIISLICDLCGAGFERNKREIRRDKPLEEQTHYCSKECVSASKRTGKTYPCLVCGKEVYRTPSSLGDQGSVFCGSSCAATLLGSKYPKRKAKPAPRCLKCLDLAVKGRKYCAEHSFPRRVDWTNVTYGQVQKKGTNKNQIIREHASYICLDRVCQNCGYDKHVEICHIKSISSHSDDTLVLTINARENLISLCPNCHWELDRGLLPLEEIQGWNNRTKIGAPDSI